MMTRRRPEFESGEAGTKAAKLGKFSAGVPEDASSSGWGEGGLKICGCPTRSEPIFESRAVYRKAK